MLVYAMMVRDADGMPLSASIDSDDLQVVQQTKKYMKAIAKQVKNIEDRCSMSITETHVIHITKALGVSYMALCKSVYPVVLAFSFLDELVKEFITTYTVRDVHAAMRPYAFIQFDSIVQKTKQRYNNPNSLVTKVNLSDLSLEIRLRPPNQLFLTDFISTSNGQTNAYSVSFPNSVGPKPKRKPLNTLDIIVMFVTGFCGLFNCIRGILALSESGFEDYNGTSPFYGLVFLFEASIQCSQLFLLLNDVRRRFIWTCFLLVVVCFCDFMVWNVRDLWHSLLYTTTGIAITFCILTRRLKEKSPNYNV